MLKIIEVGFIAVISAYRVEWSLVLSGWPNGCVPTDCGLTPRRRTSCGVRPSDGVSTLTPLSVCGALIRPSTYVRDLGVLLESDLSMRRHVAWTVGCCFRQLRLIRSCIKSLSLGAAKAAVAAFVTSRVDRYNSLLAGAPACLLDGLQSVLNAAARLICNRRKYDHVTPLLRNVLHWLPVPFRIEYKLCLLVFLSLHGASPEYLRDFCAGTDSSASGLRLRSLERLISVCGG